MRGADDIGVLSHLEKLLKAPAAGGTATTVFKMHGGTTASDRGALVTRFNDHAGPAAFLMSLRACSQAINLTSATRAVLCEPHWNPMYAAQAAARCHRIGQTRPVEVYRLVCNGTFESKIQVRDLEVYRLPLRARSRCVTWMPV